MSTHPKKTFTKNDLDLIASSSKNGYIIKVHQTKEGLWTISLVTENKNILSIITARGKVKSWRNMMSAIIFTQENCQKASQVLIEVGGWKFEKKFKHQL